MPPTPHRLPGWLPPGGALVLEGSAVLLGMLALTHLGIAGGGAALAPALATLFAVRGRRAAVPAIAIVLGYGLYLFSGFGNSFALHPPVWLGWLALGALGAAAAVIARNAARREVAAVRTATAAELDALRATAEGAEQRHTDFLDGLDAAVWEIDAATETFVSVGRYARALFGYPSERWFGEPRFWAALVDAADRERVRDAFRRARERGRDFGIEYRAVARDGWTVWLRDSVKVVRDAEGTVCGFRGVAVNVTESRHAEDALRQSEARYRGLFEGVPVGVFRLSPQGRFLSANPALVQMLGCPDAEALYAMRDDAVCVDPADRWRWQSALAQVDGVRTFELGCRRWDGTPIWVRNTARAVRTPEGAVSFYEGVIEDITARKRAEAAEREAEGKFRGLVEQSLVGIVIVRDERVLYANPKLCQIFGHRRERIAELPSVRELAAEEDREALAAYLERCLRGEGEAEPLRLRGQRRDGAPVHVEVHATRTEYNGAPAVIGTVLDTTDRKDAEDKLIRGALHDTLTGLPNRRLLLDRLEHAVRRRERDETQQFALLFLDLDRFKVVNDSLGHHVGDELLVAVARRLQNCIRPGDTVARFGGDEFAILLEGIEGIADATRVAERIQAEMAPPVNLSGYEAFTAASIGITLGGAGYDRAEYLLRNADMAMYRAKASGLARYEVFDRAMHAEALTRLQLETDLRRAVEREELRLCYQPIVCLATGHIAGFEALVRWEHPDRGMISPAEFIPVAEEIGVVLAIGGWVLRAATRQLAAWQTLLAGRALTMAVNLSVKQLLTPELTEGLQTLLATAPFSARDLKLEITESMVLEHGEPAIHMLDRLKRLGVQLHLDDFGTGYSSLSYLHRLPIDALKIDRSFVSRIGNPGDDAHLVRTIINLARGVGLGVVAEGVESTPQLAELRALGCDFAQGYLFSRPLSAEAATALLLREPWRSDGGWESSEPPRGVIPLRQSS